MNDILYHLRIKNLRSLAEEHGGQSALLEKMNVSPNLLAQYIGNKPTRNIGEEFARRVESSLGLEANWLDKNHNKN